MTISKLAMTGTAIALGALAASSVNALAGGDVYQGAPVRHQVPAAVPVPAPVPVPDIATGYYVRIDAAYAQGDVSKYTATDWRSNQVRGDSYVDNFPRYGFGAGYDPFWDMPQTETRQMFTRRVELDIYRGANYATGPKQRIFEGRAVSTGQNGQIEPVMPYMLDAVFKDFPGRSGASSTVTVQVPEDVERSGERTYRPAARSSY